MSKAEEIKKHNREYLRGTFEQRSVSLEQLDFQDVRSTLFTLMSALYDKDLLQEVVGQRIDTDYLLYQLALNDEECMKNLLECAPYIKEIPEQLALITKEFDVRLKRIQAMESILAGGVEHGD